mmetsp:Transcript_56625/g.160740  ORF Transcript_56625/g.160740 Transcript_56625/m.160740 type:complete len:304 (+) Transcript_56625:2074-2985(+)
MLGVRGSQFIELRRMPLLNLVASPGEVLESLGQCITILGQPRAPVPHITDWRVELIAGSQAVTQMLHPSQVLVTGRTCPAESNLEKPDTLTEGAVHCLPEIATQRRLDLQLWAALPGTAGANWLHVQLTAQDAEVLLNAAEAVFNSGAARVVGFHLSELLGLPTADGRKFCGVPSGSFTEELLEALHAPLQLAMLGAEGHQFARHAGLGPPELTNRGHLALAGHEAAVQLIEFLVGGRESVCVLFHRLSQECLHKTEALCQCRLLCARCTCPLRARKVPRASSLASLQLGSMPVSAVPENLLK